MDSKPQEHINRTRQGQKIKQVKIIKRFTFKKKFKNQQDKTKIRKKTNPKTQQKSLLKVTNAYSCYVHLHLFKTSEREKPPFTEQRDN